MARFRSDPPKPLRDVLNDFMEHIPYRKRLKRGMVLSLWNETVGEAITEQAANIHFEHGNLVIHVKNPAWRNEIHMKRYSIAKRLNDKVGEKVVKEIVVRS